MPRTPASVEKNPLKAPGPWLIALEGRAPWELAAMLAARPWLKRLTRGDGHPVLVFPGLGAPDLTTLPLRRFLRDAGYTPYAWEQGLNAGPRDGVLERCRERAEQLYRQHAQPVSLVGWSLGGVYAREVAKQLPTQTRCVITLGTPFTGHPRATNLWWLYELLSGQKLADAAALLEQLGQAPPVPTTSVFSRTDGVVSWQCSFNRDADHAENIEVQSSHFGMVMNPLVLYAMADRLAQAPGRWQRFHSEGWRRWFFKTPSGAGASTPG